MVIRVVVTKHGIVMVSPEDVKLPIEEGNRNDAAKEEGVSHQTNWAPDRSENLHSMWPNVSVEIIQLVAITT